MRKRHSWAGSVVVVAVLVGGGADLQAQTAATSAQPVPLRTGLTIVTALNEPDKGDYESIKQIIDVNDKSVRLRYSAEVRASAADDNPMAALLGGKPATKKADGSEVRRLVTTRTVAREDLQNAVQYRWMYNESAPESYPGSTAVGVSRKVLTDLKTKGETALRVPGNDVAGTLGSLLGGILGGSSKELDDATMWSGSLKRVSEKPVAFKVILNDDPVELPAIHARGKLAEHDAEFWILDDPDNPLALRWHVGETRLQVIKLSYPLETARATTPAGTARPKVGGGGGAGVGAGGGAVANAAAGTAKRIEEDLAKEGRAIVYGIYFDFASDRIKEESEPVLAEIAQVLRQNATWNLNVEGHTDSIGGDSYNLPLSQRRSAAVRQALVTRYKIDAQRLQTSGHGASRPKDRNDTMEGRARNRRVELVKAP